MTERNHFVDIMRGIAMLLVVLGHTMNGCTRGAESTLLYNVIWSLQMPLFILISGYITQYSKPIENFCDLKKYLSRRTIAYICPLVVWSFIRGFVFRQSLFLNIRYMLWHMDSGYWFLATIWTISVIFGISSFIARKIGKDSTRKISAVTLILYVTGMGLLAGIGSFVGLTFFAIKLTLYYSPFYAAGYLYGQHRKSIIEAKQGKTILDVIVTVSLAIWLIALTRFQLYALPDSGFSILLRVIASITGCIAVCGLCKGLFTIVTNRPSFIALRWIGVTL